jgi:adenosylcobyric acid synthase
VNGVGSGGGDGGGGGKPAETTIEGFGRLPVETVFSADKTVEAVSVQVTGGGFLPEVETIADGYEIHMGETSIVDDLEASSVRRVDDAPLGPQSVATHDTIGTYVHGLFENARVREAFVESVYDGTDRTPPNRTRTRRAGLEAPAEKAAELVTPVWTALDAELDSDVD